MRSRFTLLFSVIIILLYTSCSKDENRLDNFFVEFATVIKLESHITFQLDNGAVLTSENTPNLELENENRVILNFTPLENNVIKINSIRPVFSDTIKEEGYPDKLETSPVKLISAWASGNYLNMSFYVDYHSKKHFTALYRDTLATQPTLHFSYSRGEDPPGAPTLTYVSFNLENSQETEFTLYVHTYDSLRRVSVERTNFIPLKR